MGNQTPDTFNLEAAAGYAMAWASWRFNNNPYRKVYIAAAPIAIRRNLLGFFRGADGTTHILDGDYIVVDRPNPHVPVLTAEEAASVTTGDLTTTLTVELATMSALRTMNHHTGQGAIASSGYVAKFLRAKFSTDVTQQMTTMAHTIGHWISSLVAFSITEIRGLRAHGKAPPVINVTIALSDDAKLRFTKMPAGTHKLALAYEAALRLARIALMQCCPEAEQFIALLVARDFVMAMAARHHMGTAYFTYEAYF